MSIMNKQLVIPAIVLGVICLLVGITFFLRPEGSSTHDLLTPYKIASVTSTDFVWYESSSNRVSFQYPKDWFVDETLGGISISSFQSYSVPSVGIISEGLLMIDIARFPNPQQPLDVWCEGNLKRAIYHDALGGTINSSTNEYPDNAKLVSYDFQRGPGFNGRWICLDRKDTFVEIVAYPLSLANVPALKQIILSLIVD